MLGSKEVIATVAVKDIGTARKFYEGVLGLAAAAGPQEPGVVIYKAGGTSIMVYESRYAGTNQATGATWSLGKEVGDTVKQLAAKGLKFEHYDMPGLKLSGDLHVGGNMKVAWFKDPDGNIHALIGT